jgi:hypothetical protein
MRLVELRQRVWFEKLSMMAEGLVASRNVPAKFCDVLTTEELKRICNDNDLPATAICWLQSTGLALFIACQKAPLRAMADIRKERERLIGDLERLRKTLAGLDFTIEFELDEYAEKFNRRTGTWTFYATRDPSVETFMRGLEKLKQRAQAAKLPTSESGRRKALPILALDLLASHLREARPHSSRHDLARLAKDLFDPILLAADLPLPRWRQLALAIWPTTPGSA